LNKELSSHLYYEKFRSYFAGATGSLKERLEDLKLISNGTAIDEVSERLAGKNNRCHSIGEACKVIYSELCEYDWALRVNEEISELQRSTMGDDHINVARTYNNIGDKLRDQDKPEQASELHTKALTICQKTAWENPMLADTYTSMAKIIANVYSNLAIRLRKLEKSLTLHEKRSLRYAKNYQGTRTRVLK
jgi:tetratricopeptide (TPR) repeat protein